MWTSRLMSIGFLGSTLALTVMSSPSSGEIISCLLADEAEPIGIDPERPTTQSFVDTEHFRVHFDTSGVDAVRGWPDPTYLDTIVAAAESTYQVVHVELGFDIPPSDGDRGGGSGIIDCYVVDMGPGEPSDAFEEKEVPETPQRDAFAFFELDNDMAQWPEVDELDLVRTEVANAYMKVVLAGYDYQASTHPGLGGADCWPFESTAAWIEDMVFDDINNNYRWLSGAPSAFFDNPAMPFLTGQHYHAEGSWIWWRFFTENFGDDLVEMCWERAKDYSASFNENIGLEFAERGIDYEAQFRRFLIWNYLSGSDYAPGHYQEGADYPHVATLDYDVYPVSEWFPQPVGCDGCRYHVFHNTGEGDSLRLGLDASAWWWVLVITKDRAGNYDDSWVMPLDGFGRGTLDIPQWPLYEKAILVPIRSADAYANPYTITAEIRGASTSSVGHEEAERTAWLASAEPSVFGAATTIRFGLPHEGDVQLAIFDARGSLITTLADGVLPAGKHESTWDGRDKEGRPVPAGVYFYRLEAPGISLTDKVILAR